MLGSKIENLKKLKENGINVPKFKVIKSSDYVNEDFFKFKYNKKLSIQENSDNLKEEIERYFKGIHIELDDKKYSVRSSCNFEDGKNLSFAGLFDTYLNIENNDIKKYIKKCFKSLYNINVIEYMLKNKLKLNKLRMNVIIQEMVDADLSGVIFTSNPNGLLNETVITVGKGLGEGIVSDRVETTNYYYNLDDNVYYYEGKKDLLTNIIIENIINLANKIKSIFGNYLDIEFSIKDDKIYILQTRNITTIDDKNILILDNSNIVESYPNISLPLTCSFVNIIYTGVFKSVSSRLLKNEGDLKKLDDVFNNMVGSSNGRLYYKISNWYYIIKFLPFSKKLIPIWQEMLGVKNKLVLTDKIELNLFKKIKIYFNFFFELCRVNSNMIKLNDKFIDVDNYFYDEYNKGLTEKKAIKLYKEIKTELLSCWDITLINDMYTFIYTALFKKMMKFKNREKEAIKYISGINNIESLKPIRELVKLSLLYDSLNYEEKTKRFNDYIKLYGDRTLEELKLETKTFRTNPELLEEKIRDYNENCDNLKKLYEKLNTDIELKKLDIFTRIVLNKCHKGIKNREISRLNRSRIFGILREIVIFLGNKFKEQGLIESNDDIFYLSMDEIIELTSKKKNVVSIIDKRKEQYKLFEMLPNYSRLIFAGKEQDKNHTSINSNKIEFSSDRLYGTPCSSGIVDGEVYVINNISDTKKIKDIKGKILVTKMTDPGWVFLLSLSKGILSEKGSILSHTAIISRELKIPSIVGIQGLHVLKTGDKVKMNGNTGEVEIIK